MPVWLREAAVTWWPLLATLALVAAVLFGARWFLERNAREGAGRTGPRGQLLMLALTAAGAVIVVLALPLDESTRAELLGLLGLLLTAAIALSSTTFIGNAMAGLMLRAIRNFRPGDFLRVGEHFGRVSEQGLLHTEIQTEDRDLTTLPNLHLVTNPVTVVRSSGTVLSATVSLGYEVEHEDVEERLLEAAHRAELREPFVQILELGDYSVTYRVAGILEEVKFILSARSKLRAGMLDSLHDAGIEIVSPSFMNQRILAVDRRVAPRRRSGSEHRTELAEPRPEAVIFDKADQAETESLLEELGAVTKRAQELERELEDSDEPGRSQLESDLEQQRARRDEIEAALALRNEDGGPG